MQLLHEELTKAIIGASMEVLNTLKPGLDEKVYERALVVELAERCHRIDQQRRFSVVYKDLLVGELVPDLIVDETVIVDLKVVTGFSDSHVAQMIGYLAITGLSTGLLVNFHGAELKWKRVVR